MCTYSSSKVKVLTTRQPQNNAKLPANDNKKFRMVHSQTREQTIRTAMADNIEMLSKHTSHGTESDDGIAEDRWTIFTNESASCTIKQNPLSY